MTYKINLADWRTVQRTRQKHSLLRELLDFSIGCLLIFYALQLSFKYQINQLHQHTVQLQQQIKQNSGQLQQLLRLQQQYQQQQSWLLILKQLSQPRPNGLYLHSLQLQNHTLQLLGSSQSTEAIQAWLQQLTTTSVLRLHLQSLQQDVTAMPYLQKFILVGNILC